MVAASLLLLTVAFGVSGGGSTSGAAGPISDIASTVAKPVRDLVNWFDDTIAAKGEVQDRKKEANDLRAENARLRDRLRRFPKYQQLEALDERLGLDRNDPVDAAVIGTSPTTWAQTMRIDKGTRDGVTNGDPVVASDAQNAGFVGFVTRAFGSTAIVTLLPDQSIQVGARLEGRDPPGVIRGAGAGTVTDLELLYIQPDPQQPITRGKLVYTAGTVEGAGELTSLAPPGLPIGRVTTVEDLGSDDQVVHVRPLVDLQRVETVRVLTTAVNGNRAP